LHEVAHSNALHEKHEEDTKDTKNIFASRSTVYENLLALP